MQEAYKRLTEAIRRKGSWQPGEGGGTDATIEMDTSELRRGETAQGAPGEQMQMQFALVDVGEMGKGVYESNFPKGTSKEDKQKRLIELWQNVWSQKPIELNVRESDGSVRQITAEFDPDYDPSNLRKTDLGKVMSNRNGSSGDRSVTLNLADDLYDLARTSEYMTSEEEQGKGTATHQGVKKWHYFFNDIIYRGEQGDVPYTVWLDVKEKADGGYVYQLYARKTKKDASATAGDSYRNPLAGISQSAGQADAVQSLGVNAAETSVYDTSVAENTPDVNTQSTQESVQYALAPNQFANKTAQQMTTISEEVKSLLMGRGHEAIANRERLDQAWEDVNTRGRDSVIRELIGKETWDAQDNVTAALCGVLAGQEGDVTTEAMIQMRYDAEGTKQGQALQSRKTALHMTPQGAMAEMIRKADLANEKRGAGKGGIPTGEEAPRQAGTTQKDGETQKTPKALEEVYEAAGALKRALDSLPGEIRYDNPWSLPLSDKQMGLIDQYRLRGVTLPGANYNIATRKQRMLAAIIAMGNEVQGDGLTTLCQQLEAMKKGLAVVTKADLNYTAAQMAEFKAIEGTDAAAPTTQAGREALGRAYQAQDNVVSAGFMEKWSNIRFTNMLSAPATAVRNVASNVLGGGLESMSTGIATAIDKAAAKKTGTRTTTIVTAAERKAGQAAFAKEIAQTYQDYFVTHVDTGHGRKYEAGGQGRVFENEFMEACRNFVDFSMQIGDRPFYEKCYAEELAVVKRLGMKHTEAGANGKIISREMTQEEMHAEATARAIKRVYQEDSTLVDAINSIKYKDPTADLVISVLMPFVKTPTNVAMRAVEYSPIGLGATLVRRLAFGLKETSGKSLAISQRDYVMGIGRGLTGTGLAVAGYVLASVGVIGFGRGEEENEKRRGILSDLGEPYSMYIEIGGQKREIDWALPAASAIAIGAEFFKNLEEGDGLGTAVGSALISGVGDQIMSTPMLSSMQDLFQGYDDTEDMVTRLFQTGISSLINQTFSPSVVRAIAKATDPYVRDTTSESGVMEVINKSVVQYWPGLRQMLPAATDMTGDKQLQSGYYSWGKEHQNAALHMLDSFFTPTATIGEKNDEALFELLDLSYRVGQTAFLPGDFIKSNKYEIDVTKTMAGKFGTGDAAHTISLTAEEKREANRLYGSLLFNGLQGATYLKTYKLSKTEDKYYRIEGIRPLIESGKWAKMTDEEKVEAVEDMKDTVRMLVTQLAIQGKL